MSVLKSHRNSGIGTNENAGRLYENLSFEVEGVKNGAVVVCGEAIDLIEMVKMVKSNP